MTTTAGPGTGPSASVASAPSAPPARAARAAGATEPAEAEQPSRPGWPEAVTALALLLAGAASAPGTMSGVVALGRQDGVLDAIVFALLCLAAAAAVLVRRARPGAAVVALGVVCAVHSLVFTTLSIMALGACLAAVETAASRVRRPWAWALLAAGCAGAPAAVIAVDARASAGPLPIVVVLQAVGLSWLFMTVALLAGLLRRRSRERRAQAAERVGMLLAQQEMETRLAVADERNRIAREVHDVVGHSLAVIAMQAEGARAVLAREPERADAALAVIGGTSRAAVEEVRSLVDVLRADDDARAVAPRPTELGAAAAAPPDGPGPGPAPGAVAPAGLLDLVGSLRTGGARVALAVDLAADAGVPEPVEDCLLAVAREATTNALHHAAGARLRLELREAADAAEVEVLNGPGGADRHPSTERTGSGLAAARARVETLGGSFCAGPSADGGWRVHARVPATGDVDARGEVDA
ncbi:sensor histidine kinase [Actinomyces haliotis]|uniref:sensor histidine kinase n=1 Tax=Actinomyces haliotis TaxID=1280843 RepID=UPI00188EF45C|nr:histidine kinase [Actinomyces haliotis]